VKERQIFTRLGDVGYSKPRDLSGKKKAPMPYQRNAKTIWGGEVVNLGLVWSWMDEKTGKTHENLIESHPDHMEAMFRRHFEKVDVIKYPKQGLHAIVANGKGD
jgi:hypothetical protein